SSDLRLQAGDDDRQLRLQWRFALVEFGRNRQMLADFADQIAGGNRRAHPRPLGPPASFLGGGGAALDLAPLVEGEGQGFAVRRDGQPLRTAGDFALLALERLEKGAGEA